MNGNFSNPAHVFPWSKKKCAIVLSNKWKWRPYTHVVRPCHRYILAYKKFIANHDETKQMFLCTKFKRKLGIMFGSFANVKFSIWFAWYAFNRGANVFVIYQHIDRHANNFGNIPLLNVIFNGVLVMTFVQMTIISKDICGNVKYLCASFGIRVYCNKTGSLQLFVAFSECTL